MIKRIIIWVVYGIFFTLMILGFIFKKNLNSGVSRLMIEKASPEIISEGGLIVDSLYNYTANGQVYKVTFLEFGANNCSACRRMVKVLDKIREGYGDRVNVVFRNILLPENQTLMKYYGITVIPTQVLLDIEGNEFFRHAGYFPVEDLTQQFNKKLN